jgi:hypothetical protein
MCTEFYLETQREEANLGDLIMDENIKLDLKEIECVGVNCIHVVQYRGQWQALWHGNDPSCSVQGRKFLNS